MQRSMCVLTVNRSDHSFAYPTLLTPAISWWIVAYPDMTPIFEFCPVGQLLDRDALKSHSCKDNWLVKATLFGH